MITFSAGFPQLIKKNSMNNLGDKLDRLKDRHEITKTSGHYFFKPTTCTYYNIPTLN
jgi:hypothetical protein